MSNIIYTKMKMNNEGNNLLCFPYQRNVSAIKKVRTEEMKKMSDLVGCPVLSCKQLNDDKFLNLRYSTEPNAYESTEAVLVNSEGVSSSCRGLTVFEEEQNKSIAERILSIYNNGEDLSKNIPVKLKDENDNTYAYVMAVRKNDARMNKEIVGYIQITRKLYLIHLLESGRIDILRDEASIEEIKDAIKAFKFKLSHEFCSAKLGNRGYMVGRLLIDSEELREHLQKLTKKRK